MQSLWGKNGRPETREYHARQNGQKVEPGSLEVTETVHPKRLTESEKTRNKWAKARRVNGVE